MTVRPVRFAYELGVMMLAIAAFGWWVLVPLALISFDWRAQP